MWKNHSVLKDRYLHVFYMPFWEAVVVYKLWTISLKIGRFKWVKVAIKKLHSSIKGVKRIASASCDWQNLLNKFWLSFWMFLYSDMNSVLFILMWTCNSAMYYGDLSISVIRDSFIQSLIHSVLFSCSQGVTQLTWSVAYSLGLSFTHSIGHSFIQLVSMSLTSFSGQPSHLPTYTHSTS